MIVFALDTNIISYLLKQDAKVLARQREELRKGNGIIIPPIAYYEIQRGLLRLNAIAKTKIFRNICGEFGVGRMGLETWNEAARLYAENCRTGRTMEDADSFTAAFCLRGHYTLVTNNVKHFNTISGLQYTNWV